jgi:hypothetical protein
VEVDEEPTLNVGESQIAQKLGVIQVTLSKFVREKILIDRLE